MDVCGGVVRAWMDSTDPDRGPLFSFAAGYFAALRGTTDDKKGG